MEDRKITRKQVNEEYHTAMEEASKIHSAAMRKANEAFSLAALQAEKVRRDGLRLADKEAGA